MLTHTQYVRLSNNGRGPTELQKLWGKRNDLSPEYQARRIHIHNTVEKMWWWLISLILGAASVTIIYNSPPWATTTDDKISFVFVMGALFFHLFSLVWLRDRWTKHYTDAQWYFPIYYGLFLEWSGLTPAGVNLRTVNQLRRTAKDILIATAKNVLQEESLKPLGLPTQANGQTSLLKGSLFEERYKVLSAMDLVEGSYQPFYDEARRQLDEEKPVSLHDGSI